MVPLYFIYHLLMHAKFLEALNEKKKGSGNLDTVNFFNLKLFLHDQLEISASMRSNFH